MPGMSPEGLLYKPSPPPKGTGSLTVGVKAKHCLGSAEMIENTFILFTERDKCFLRSVDNKELWEIITMSF